MLVWEVATYGESPHKGIQISELVELANDGSLKLNRYIANTEDLINSNNIIIVYHVGL